MVQVVSGLDPEFHMSPGQDESALLSCYMLGTDVLLFSQNSHTHPIPLSRGYDTSI